MENAVTVNDLSVKFKDFYAVKKISFSVKKGEIFGFLGANGAGKTTTIRVLCGLLLPSEGDVRVTGINLKTEKDGMQVKKNVGYMSQKFTLYDGLTIEENLSFIASLRNMDFKKYVKRRTEILEFISFKKPLDSFVKDLPGGIKQQVSLAASILHDPDIVFLDEPTAGVTPVMRARFWALIKDLAKLHKTVFVTTHYMDEAEQCEKIALMSTGEIVALGSPQNLKEKAFPGDLYEFIPKKKMAYSDMQKIKEKFEFDFFEPYGIKFHGAFKEESDVERLKLELQQDFDVSSIEPTLEDVFIKLVESKEVGETS